jgi:tRNA(His) 5'-end guanylyltransferase
MREREIFSAIRLLPGAWTVIRLDGRAFTGFTAERFEKPFDWRMRDVMVHAASALLEDFSGAYACTHSDEISVAFVPEWVGGT